MKKRSMVAILSCAGLIACGNGPDPALDGGGGLDAGSGTDAQTPDAQTSLDAGTSDGDGDGVPTARDCDDTDASVGETAERPCTTACGAGLERCTAGTWAACDAPTECTCDTPGMMRLAPCERCGMRSERCGAAGMWEAVSGCVDQGACEVAALESRRTDSCGMEQRICGAACAWGTWSTVVPDGECRPGDIFDCPGDWRLELFCDDTCRIESTCR